MQSYDEYLNEYQTKAEFQIRDEIKKLKAVLAIRNQIKQITQTLRDAGCGITSEELVKSTVGDLITCLALNGFQLIVQAEIPQIPCLNSDIGGICD